MHTRYASTDLIGRCIEYDKRSANGAVFVYFGMLPVDSASSEAKLLVAYGEQVLKALELTNGPAHTEIIFTAR